MNIAGAAPYFVSGCTVVIASFGQAMALSQLRARLDMVYARQANDSFRSKLPKANRKVTTRQVVPDAMSPDALMQDISQSFDAAQAITAGLSLTISAVAITSTTGEFDFGLVEIIAMIGLVLTTGWFTAALVLPGKKYATFFHPRRVWPLKATSGLSLPSLILGASFFVLAVMALFQDGSGQT